MHCFHEPISFSDELEKNLATRLFRSYPPQKQELDNLGTDLSRLWPTLAKQRGQMSSDHYGWDMKLAKAYAAYYLPANALKISTILKELEFFGVDYFSENKTRWLDFGCGPGTLYWGLKESELDFQYTGFDFAKTFVKIAKDLTGEARFDVLKNTKKDILEKLSGGDFDCVSFMNSIAEIEPDLAKRKAWFQECLAVLKSKRTPTWVFLIEPGSLAATRELLELRETYREQVKVLLPCLDERPCGALLNPKDWCHEEVEMKFPKWHDDLGAKAGLHKENLLFSYSVFVVGDLKLSSFPVGGKRVVSQRLKEKGLTKCFLCTRAGKVQARVLDSKVVRETEFFQSIRRGEVFTEMDLDEKGNVTGVKPFK